MLDAALHYKQYKIGLFGRIPASKTSFKGLNLECFGRRLFFMTVRNNE